MNPSLRRPVTRSEQPLNAGRRCSSSDHIPWHWAQEQRKCSRKEKYRNICPTDLSPSPHWRASPLDPALSLTQASVFPASPPNHSSAQSSPGVGASHFTSLLACESEAFPGSQVKVLAGGQGFYLLPLWCSLPSQPSPCSTSKKTQKC